MDLTFVLAVAILLIPLQHLLSIYLRRKKIAEIIDPLGGEKWYPIIGTTLRFIRTTREDFYDAFMERNKLYGPYYRSWMGTIPAIHIMRADLVEPVLSSNSNLAKGDSYKFFVPWLGEGLITGAGMKWRTHRKLLTPTFHFSVLDKMGEVFYEKALALTNLIAPRASGEFFNIYPDLTHCSLDIIFKTAMGLELNAMDNRDSVYVKALYGVTDVMLYRMFHPYLHSDFIFNLTSKGRLQKKHLSILHGFTRKVIQERKEKLEQGINPEMELTEEDKFLGKKKRLAFLDLLLEANKKKEGGLSDEDIREEVDNFMFAGHDTTTVTVAWTLFILANFPEIQEKVHQELEEVFQGKERPITPQDILEMQYLDRVVKESQRLIPVVPVTARTLDTDTEIGGRVIPSGVMVVLHLASLHKDPEQFPDPERFDPDRFLPENIAKRHPYAYIPFSAGPRNCIGQKFAQRSTRIILATILRRFKVKSQKKLSEMKYLMEIVLRPNGGLYLAFEPRKRST